MKYIKTLRIITFIIFGILLFELIGSIIITVSEVIFEKPILKTGYWETENPPLILKFMVIFKLVSVILFTIGVSFLVRILKVKSIKEYFSTVSSFYFRNAGLYILCSGVLAFILTISSYFFRESKFIFYMNLNNLPFLTSMIIGLFFLLFSKILLSANEIKQENDSII